MVTVEANMPSDIALLRHGVVFIRDVVSSRENEKWQILMNNARSEVVIFQTEYKE